MPRKPVIYTHLFPYHISARSNNQEWFSAPQEICWGIFVDKLSHIVSTYQFKVHAFVLMSNHYHLIGSVGEKHSLGYVMDWFQTNVSKAINKHSGRINRVFGAPYKPTMIADPFYYAHCTRYVYQNPVRAQICKDALSYKYTTARLALAVDQDLTKISLASAPSGVDCLIQEMSAEERLKWFDTLYDKEDITTIKRATSRSEFRFALDDKTRRDSWMKNKLKK